MSGNARTIVDPDGKFALAVAPGRYDVEADAAGFAPVTIVASPSDAIRIALGAGRTLRGKVVSSADGMPIAGARVVRDTTTYSGHGMPATLGALTGADGQFELAGIPPGPFTVTISAEHHHSRIEWRTADERADPSPIVASLAPLAAGAEPHTDYVGIGITSTSDGDDILIEMVTPGGGAEAAGIKAGDRIVTIDGVAAAEIGEPASVARIRGMPNTTVTLGIRRGDQVVAVVVTRSQVQS